MEATKVPLREIKIDPLAHELATSQGTKPYLECLIKAYRNNAVGLEAALEVIRDLPLEKRYTWRVFSAVKWAFADFEDEYVALDLPHISEPMRSEMTKELERVPLAVSLQTQDGCESVDCHSIGPQHNYDLASRRILSATLPHSGF